MLNKMLSYKMLLIGLRRAQLELSYGTENYFLQAFLKLIPPTT